MSRVPFSSLSRVPFSSPSYDTASRVTNLQHAHSTLGTLASFGYTLYDDANQLKTYTGPEGMLTYNYDNTGQLTGAAGAYAESYSYDVNGNRTTMGYTTGTGNRMTSDGAFNYTYDDEGNVTSQTLVGGGPATEYVWDHRNRLTRVTQGETTLAQFTYDVQDRRVGKLGAAGQLWTVYDGANAYADFDAAGAVTQRYLYGPGLDFLLARLTTAGAVTAWYLTDRLGSVRQLVQTNGTILYQAAYDSYGNVVSGAGTGDRYGYTAREYDAETGLYYYRARYYSTTAGRFWSEDPIWDDINTYRYVGNSPTNATDPLGLQTAYDIPKEVREALDRAWKLTQDDKDKNEQGGFIIKDKDGKLRIVEVEGKKSRVDFDLKKLTLKEGETILGTYHTHPSSKAFSDVDIVSFLRGIGSKKGLGEIMIVEAGTTTYVLTVISQDKALKADYDTVRVNWNRGMDLKQGDTAQEHSEFAVISAIKNTGLGFHRTKKDRSKAERMAP